MSTPYKFTGTQNYKVTTPGIGGDSFSTDSNLSRTLPRQMSTGSTRGTQIVGYGNTKIDGSKNSITLGTGIILDGTNEIITVENNSTPVINIGKDKNNDFNFRVVDKNNVGLAQFGQFPDGSIALKVAQSGVEVATAQANQLVFSSTSSFTVLKQSSYTFPSFGAVPADTLNGGSYTTIAHNAGFVPNVNCFTPFAFSGVTYVTAPAGFPISLPTFVTSGSAITQISGASGDAFFNFFWSVDSTNLYLGATFQNSTSSTVTALPLTINYTIFVLSAVNQTQ